jgi:Capsule polysaccharide biosynthesis protein
MGLTVQPITTKEVGEIASHPIIMSGTPEQSCRYKIALYGFGSQPVVYRHLIELAAKEKLAIKWCAILTTPHYRGVIDQVLAEQEILDVFHTLPRSPMGGDIACLSHYAGSLVEDLAAQKRSQRKRSGTWLLNRGLDYYSLYKKFFVEHSATHLLMSSIETPDAKIAVAVARELGIGVIAPVDMRNITGTYFSIDCYETPPGYAESNSESRTHAIEFISRFRKNPTPARGLPIEIAPNLQDMTLSTFLPPLWLRVKRFMMNIIERPDMFDYDQVRVAIMANATVLRKTIRGVREWLNSSQYDIADVGTLPNQFIYYPLQFSPESSINTPAPYFLDQMRAIDALRFAMPSDHVLVVKEHPACAEMRPVKFIRHIRNLPGVIVIKSSVPSVEIMKRATLTATVTGTAALEAFLLGRPAIALGPGISAWAIGRISGMVNLRADVLNAVNNPASDDFRIDQIAKLLSVRYPFVFTTPHHPGEPMLRLQNMQRFLSALLDHLEREGGLHERMPRAIA